MEHRGVLAAGLVVLIVVLIAVAGLVPVAAQDGDPVADPTYVAELVERVVWAEQAALAWTSFAAQTTSANTAVLEVAFMRQTQSVQVAVDTSRSAQIVRQDGVPNVDAQISGTFGETIGLGAGGYRTYTVEGQSRWVDGALYVDAQYTSARTDLPQLSHGWALVEDRDSHEVYARLPLDDFSQGAWILRDPAALKRAITSASVAADTLDDGTPVDVIRFEIAGAELAALFDEIDMRRVLGSSYTLLAGNLAEDSVIVMQVALDQTGTLRSIAISLDLHTDWLDGAQFSEQYAVGAQVRLAVSLRGEQHFSAINVPVSPVPAPEIRGY